MKPDEEAKAIAMALAGQVHDNIDARCVETLAEQLISTVLEVASKTITDRENVIERLHDDYAELLGENQKLTFELVDAKEELKELRELAYS